MKKLLSLIFVSLLLSGSANATMKGIFEVELVVEILGPPSKECSITEQKVETAVKYILQNSKIKLKEDPYNPLLYVKVVVVKTGGVCTTSTRISLLSLYAKDPLGLENSGRFEFYSDQHITSGGPLSTFGNSAIGAMEEMMKKLVVEHHEDNK
tara:strand:- start:37 stop:495 length:459 start_codon:yes stop_codon:yes gene_type:complete